MDLPDKVHKTLDDRIDQAGPPPGSPHCRQGRATEDVAVSWPIWAPTTELSCSHIGADILTLASMLPHPRIRPPQHPDDQIYRPSQGINTADPENRLPPANYGPLYGKY